MKKLLWIVLCVVAFIITFVVFFVIGIVVPTAKYAEPLNVAWNEDVGDIIPDLKYGEWEDTAYDLYIPKKLNEEKEVSLILFIHGGSFTAGDKADEDMWCKFYASKGYITATIKYSLMAEGSDASINMMNEQILSCVEAIKAECAKKGYDIKQMALSGQSAGGCLAMLYAYSQADTSPIPVKFVFQQTGPASFHIEHWGGTEDDAEEVAKSAAGSTGKEITAEMVADRSYRELVDAISPASLVNENTVPTLCAYGPNDKIVPIGIKFVLFEQFDKYGVTYDFINFENSGHGMMNDPDRQKEFVEKSLEYCDRYFE